MPTERPPPAKDDAGGNVTRVIEDVADDWAIPVAIALWILVIVLLALAILKFTSIAEAA